LGEPLKITVTGASGFIGRRLLKSLAVDAHTVQVLSRHAGTNMPGNIKVWPWDPAKAEPPADALRDTDAVIHLAGEPVAQRWSSDVKQRIRDSRELGTRNLVQAMSKLPKPPGVLVCASASGYYGSRGDEILTEESPAGSGFLADVCRAWEAEALKAEAFGIRVVRVRIGIVLDSRGGALQKMLPPFKMGVGGKMGSGKQWMSWIHIDDLVGIFRCALEQRVPGVMNGAAPYPVVNDEFTRTLAAALHRPAIFPVPEFALKLLFGEMSEVLFASQRLAPKAAEQAGYRYRFPQLSGALADILK
jgi:uncharacterized protein